MRATVDLDPDTARAVRDVRRDQGCGASEAINELIRRGMLAELGQRPFVARSERLEIRIDVSNVADAIDLLEGPEAC